MRGLRSFGVQASPKQSIPLETPAANNDEFPTRPTIGAITVVAAPERKRTRRRDFLGQAARQLPSPAALKLSGAKALVVDHEADAGEMIQRLLRAYEAVPALAPLAHDMTRTS